MKFVNILLPIILLYCLHTMALAESPIISSLLSENPVHVREKRTVLLFKKKILEAGLLGAGLGAGLQALKSNNLGYNKKPYSYYSTSFEYPVYYVKQPYYSHVHYSY